MCQAVRKADYCLPDVFSLLLLKRTNMTIKIDPNSSEKAIQAALKKVRSTKKLNAAKYFGKIKWDEDPLTFQRSLRDEWN